MMIPTQDCGVDGKMKIFQPETERFYSNLKNISADRQ